MFGFWENFFKKDLKSLEKEELEKAIEELEKQRRDDLLLNRIIYNLRQRIDGKISKDKFEKWGNEIRLEFATLLKNKKKEMRCVEMLKKDWEKIKKKAEEKSKWMYPKACPNCGLSLEIGSGWDPEKRICPNCHKKV